MTRISVFGCFRVLFFFFVSSSLSVSSLSRTLTKPRLSPTLPSYRCIPIYSSAQQNWGFRVFDFCISLSQRNWNISATLIRRSSLSLSRPPILHSCREDRYLFFLMISRVSQTLGLVLFAKSWRAFNFFSLQNFNFPPLVLVRA